MTWYDIDITSYGRVGLPPSIILMLLLDGFERFRRLPSLFQETPRSQGGGGGGGSGEVGYEPFAKQQPQNAGNIWEHCIDESLIKFQFQLSISCFWRAAGF